ncbi:MAG TPA: YceI family protein, partial [Myxococcota bacterium]|nr:YceI family protein [Myxococcota bacterium]
MRHFALTLLLALPWSVAGAAPVEYTLLPQESLLYVQVFKDRSALLSRLAHDHVIRASQWSGTVRVDSRDVSHCEVDIDVAVAGLVVDEPEMRALVGYAQMLDPTTRAKIDGHMRANRQLNAGVFPGIHFTSLGCVPQAAGTALVRGVLELHGWRQTVDVPMRFHFTGNLLQAAGTFALRQQDFG